MEHRKAAVVGAGVAGLTAAHILARSYEVTLYEADGRLGGHAHTHELPGPDGRLMGVDSGFIVHNERTYPTLLRLFRELGITTQDAEMSMSVRCDGCGLEYAGARGPSGLFTGRPALRGRYLALLAQVPVFHRRARRLLADPPSHHVTFGDFLRAGRFSPYFVSHFALPLVSAVWSCPASTALSYPAAHLFTFLHHHGLLSVTGSPQWKTVTGGSAAYVQAAAKSVHRVRTDSPVQAVHRAGRGSGAWITTENGATDGYDAVVIATHPDQALRLLADPTEDERRLLGAFTYEPNPTVLHTDTGILPRSPRARACWNYHMPACAPSTEAVRVSYDMRRLQKLPDGADYVVTLGADDRVDADRVVRRMLYEHPVYTPASVAAQKELPRLNTGVTAYAGAWHGWGFHEDGCRSGAAAARSLGVRW
ncbi:MULTISPECIES: NAD(P)/FAD-dependent oxidoreductase [unclassified Streptomyces]|uniref:NAD(P)/FAD-dependent oxidoreductase n=1 Tax=unclassified Streptomyces TaxID=2593676 RepID=UPI00044E8FEA|nr:FAD-dependent oxidoreductase [Streptomyces sp. PCS3-D2]WKV70150.1 FAD-dependent oxidoreductase [Streptomyces sp. PCS3-D2]